MSKLKYMYAKYFSVSILIMAAFALQAQDTSKLKSVQVTSTFRPVLKDAAKINFNASPAPIDTSRPVLQYSIPNPNLVFAFQPGSLKPLALHIDSVRPFDNSNFVKVGFGSLRTPVVQAGFSFGDGLTAGGNFYVSHVASEGTRDYQDFSSTGVGFKGYYKANKSTEWSGGIGMQQDKTYKYGFEPQSLSFTSDSIRQKFQDINARLAVRNYQKTEYGISYNPSIDISVFSDNHDNKESNSVLTLPLEKTVAKAFLVKLSTTFDLGRYSPKGVSALNNTIWNVAPSVTFLTNSIKLQGGIRPSWDNGDFKLFPNILAEVGTQDKQFFVQAGWTGYVRKTTYKYLTSQNQWLWAPATLKNTWIEERFAGFKGSLSDHFNYGAKVSFNTLNNQPLFLNNTGDGKSFKVVYEPRVNQLNIGGQLGFTIEEKFSLLTSINFNQYMSLKENAKAWGLSPMDINAALRLQIIKDLWLKTDLYSWNGSSYLAKDGTIGSLPNVLDLNAGLEFKIHKNISLWSQFNNLLNNQYQRWHQYTVYGFNFAGGIIFSFDQKNSRD